MHAPRKIDMTKGPIMRLIILFALPLCAGNILQQLYGTVDTVVIGNFCGATSLAAVGTGTLPSELLLCFFLGFGTGVSILVSQYTGSGNASSLKELAATSITFLYISGIIISLLGLLLGPVLLKLMQCPDDTWNQAVTYVRIIFLGCIGNMGYNMNAGILRGLGDSSSSLLFLVISCFINIALDLIFVALLGMDVAGAALATVMAMLASWLVSIVYIKKKYPELDFTFLPRKLNPDMLRQILSVGLPLGLNNSIYSIGHVLMQSMINAQGSVFMAACAVASKMTNIADITIIAFSTASTTFAGQNLGAGNYARLRKGAVWIPLFSGIVAFLACACITACCRPILRLFTQDAAVLHMAVRYVHIVLPFFGVYAILDAMIYFINGIGVVKFPTVVNVLMLWAVRIPCAYLIGRFINGHYIMASISVSYVFGLAAISLYFLSGHWRNIKKMARQQTETSA